MDREFLKKHENPYISHCEADTLNLAKDLSKELLPGDVVALKGDLGTGKTTFTKALALALGVKDNVSSPTFTIVKEYRSGKIPLFHFDAYRLSDEDEFYDIGAEEYMSSGGITVIEWADIVEDALPNNTIVIDIEYGNEEEERIFTFDIK